MAQCRISRQHIMKMPAVKLLYLQLICFTFSFPICFTCFGFFPNVLLPFASWGDLPNVKCTLSCQAQARASGESKSHCWEEVPKRRSGHVVLCFVAVANDFLANGVGQSLFCLWRPLALFRVLLSAGAAVASTWWSHFWAGQHAAGCHSAHMVCFTWQSKSVCLKANKDLQQEVEDLQYGAEKIKRKELNECSYGTIEATSHRERRPFASSPGSKGRLKRNRRKVWSSGFSLLDFVARPLQRKRSQSFGTCFCKSTPQQSLSGQGQETDRARWR